MLVRDDERAILAIYERCRECNEARHDQTARRIFELNFESRDLPHSKAARADASDNGRCATMIAIVIDSDWVRERRTWQINRAAASLPRRHVHYRELLWAIYRNGSNRDVSIAELKIDRSTYWRGVKFLLNFFSAQ